MILAGWAFGPEGTIGVLVEIVDARSRSVAGQAHAAVGSGRLHSARAEAIAGSGVAGVLRALVLRVAARQL